MRFILTVLILAVIVFLTWKFYPDVIESIVAWVERGIEWVKSTLPHKDAVARTS